ncbi:hypothetical protein MPSEU_001047300 [Mayamaea pseudoterrestris]|nr:hypothetical protein MPSEU_001047300 [Mayamaea pseudoterrestris]
MTMNQQPTSTDKPSPNWMAHVDELLTSQPSTDFEGNDEDSDDESDDGSSIADESETDCDFSMSEMNHVVKESTNKQGDASFVAAKPSAATAMNHQPTPRSVHTTLHVPVATKKVGGGIFISDAMRQFLSRNHSDGDLAQHGRNEAIQNLIYKSESAEKLGPKNHSRMVIVHQDKPKAASVTNTQRPKDLLQELLAANGINKVEPRSYKTLLESYFLKVTPEMISSYDVALMTAVRTNDLATMQRFHDEGRNLQCCNRFHESILHTAARRGCTDIMSFLLHTAKLDLKVVCDSGRTPLHDSCWTGRPNFDVVTMILEACPDFLLISDNRNFTPLDYIPKEAYQEWCDFLTEHQTLIVPRVVG